MFSPSLLSMMYHSLDDDPLWAEGGQSFEGTDHAARVMMSMVEQHGPRSDWPEVPVSAWSDDASAAREVLQGKITIDRPSGEGAHADRQYFWGRVPVNSLVALLSQQAGEYAKTSEREYIDLGTPIDSFSPTRSAAEQLCDRFVPSAGAAQQVTVALVDLRDDTAPRQYANWIRHTDPDDLKFDGHALTVLAALAQRLAHNGALGKTSLAVATAEKPSRAIGRTCFRHLNVVDVQSALARMRSLTQPDSNPVVISTSLGTHVGPHNGLSPLEDYVSRLVRFHPKHPRHVVAAVGNYGLSNVCAWGGVKRGIAHPISLRVAPGAHHEILVEFWWNESGGGSPIMEVDALDLNGTSILNSK